MNDDRYRALAAEWRRSPPAHWLIAAFMRYKAPAERDEAAAPPSAPSVAELQAAFPNGRLPG